MLMALILGLVVGAALALHTAKRLMDRGFDAYPAGRCAPRWGRSWWFRGFDHAAKYAGLRATTNRLLLTEKHLRAFGGDAAVTLAMRGHEAPAPSEALTAAKRAYLIANLWIETTGTGEWTPTWAPHSRWNRAHAVKRQRERDETHLRSA